MLESTIMLKQKKDAKPEYAVIIGKDRKELINKIEKLKAEIKILKKPKNLGLVWEGKKEDVIERCKGEAPVLTEISNNNISIDNTKFTNIMIEGDNYHSLSILNYTHREKIDVIYIDPPYNIGKEFVYNDKRIDKDDSYKHSMWLSFMSKRLELAKKLLSKEGVIFISIDDNEQAHLRLLCNKIFGENNFIANIMWQKKFSPQNDAKYFSDTHDFILVYVKMKATMKDDKHGWQRNLLPRTEKMKARYKNPDNDKRGNWSSGGLDVKTYNPEYDYEITTPSGRKVCPPKGTCWRVSSKKFAEMVADNRIWFGKNGNNVPRIKRFESEVQPGVVPITWWEYGFAGHNQEAKQELNRFGLKTPFDNPKPVKLIKKILQIASKKNSCILDFFAGSGTTGQAVLELNKEDGGNRRFILCTNNENNICADICYPRIKKVIRGYVNTKKEKIEGCGGGGLRYFKTKFACRRSTDKNKHLFIKQATQILCLKNNAFEPVCKSKYFKIFKNHTSHMGIIYEYDGIKPFVREIKKRKIKTKAYMFSYSDIVLDEEFSDVAEFVNLTSAPTPLLDTYRSIFKNV